MEGLIKVKFRGHRNIETEVQRCIYYIRTYVTSHPPLLLSLSLSSEVLNTYCTARYLDTIRPRPLGSYLCTVQWLSMVRAGERSVLRVANL